MIKEEVFRVITSMEQEKNGVSMWLARLQFFSFFNKIEFKIF